MDKLLVDVLAQEQTWADLIEAMNEVFELNIEEPISQILKVRALDQNSDKDLVFNTCRMLGFDLTQDVLALSSDTLGRIANQLPHYQAYKGSPDFYRFIDLLLHSDSTIVYLYTKDYVNFYDEPQGALIDEGGVWFKTTHIDLTMALVGLRNIILNSGQSIYSRVQEIFWNFAPISLVIKKFSLSVQFNVTVGFAATLLRGDSVVQIRSR